jgi:hypothetical protein
LELDLFQLIHTKLLMGDSAFIRWNNGIENRRISICRRGIFRQITLSVDWTRDSARYRVRAAQSLRISGSSAIRASYSFFSSRLPIARTPQCNLWSWVALRVRSGMRRPSRIDEKCRSIVGQRNPSGANGRNERRVYPLGRTHFERQSFLRPCSLYTASFLIHVLPTTCASQPFCSIQTRLA